MVEKEVVREVKVPGETVVVEKEVVREVKVPGETVVVEKEVVREVKVPGETVVVEKEVVREVKVPGETVVVKEEVVKEVEVIKEVEKIVQVEVRPGGPVALSTVDPEDLHSFIYTGPAPTTFGEAPILAELVRAGELPPVVERLPKEPLVLPVVDRAGDYGGNLAPRFHGARRRLEHKQAYSGQAPYVGHRRGYHLREHDRGLFGLRR